MSREAGCPEGRRADEAVTDIAPGSPGNHPHADRPNWQPGDAADDYFERVKAGLDPFSQRRAAKALGVSRSSLRRWMSAATIPEDLFERLLATHKTSTKELAAVGDALAAGQLSESIERCPHCSGMLRIRASVRPSTLKVVNDWLREREAAA